MLRNTSSELSPSTPFAEPISKNGLFLILILQTVLFLSALFLPLKVKLSIFLGVAGTIFILVNKDPLFASLLLSVFVTIILPRPTGRSLFFKVEEIFPFLTIFFLLLAFWEGKVSQIPIGRIGKFLLGFLVVVTIAAFLGLSQGRSKILIFDEALIFFLWGIYFVILKMNLQEKEMKKILLMIILASLIVSLYYIYQFHFWGGTRRAATDQQHIFNFAIPLLFAAFLYETERARKFFAILLMIPMFIAVYTTLTRALWLLIPLTLFFQYFYFIRDPIQKKRFHSYLFPIFLVIIISLLGLIVLNALFDISKVLGGRLASLKILEYDVSLLARMELAHYILEKFQRSPLLGVGLADFVRYRYFLSPFNIYLVDSTYLQLLWKTGILGLALFLGALGFFLSRAWFILRKGRSAFDKIIGSSIFFSFLALIITGLESAILVGYRFNLVWAVLAGITEIRAREIERCRRLTNQSGKD